MYKESQEILRVSIDEARKEGRKQLVKGMDLSLVAPPSVFLRVHSSVTSTFALILQIW